MHPRILLVAAIAALCTSIVGASSCRAPSKTQLTFSPEKERVKLVFAGDLSTARDVARAIDEAGGGDPAFPFSFVRPLVGEADLFFANLECVLSDSDAEEVKAKTFRIRSPLKYASKLKEVGVDVVSVANNHAMDFGAAGFASTLTALHAQKLISVGARIGGEKKQRPVIVRVGKAKVGFLAYNQFGDEWRHDVFPKQSWSYSIEAVVEDVKAARPLVDFLVVSVHGGPELSHLPVDWQRKHSRQVIDAGGDLWLGHHAHVIQPIEEYKGKLIVYSLGDFVFDKRSQFLRDRTGPRFFLEIELDGKKQAGWKVLAGNHDKDYRPMLTPQFPLDPWLKPRAPARYLSDQISKAKVERLHGDTGELCTKSASRVKIPGGYLRWLAPRFECANEKKTPWLTVARTGELSDQVFAQGIWAHPHADGPLRITFPNVPLGPKLDGFGGVPDFGFYLGRKKPPAPVAMRVLIADDKAPIDILETFPFEKGWKPFVVDTSAFDGSKRDIIVEITGGAGAAENRFMFDLSIAAASAAADKPEEEAEGQ